MPLRSPALPNPDNPTNAPHRELDRLDIDIRFLLANERTLLAWRLSRHPTGGQPTQPGPPRWFAAGPRG